MNYKGIIYYPKFFNEVAEVIGLARWNENKKNRKANNDYQRDNKDNEIRIDTIGVLAEMIALYHLTNQNKKFTYSVLLSKRPQFQNDISIQKEDDGYTHYEVKAVTENFARINKQSHEKKPCDFYIFIRPTKELDNEMQSGAYYWTAHYTEIKDWTVKEGAYNSPYYEKQLIIDAMTIIEQATKEMENK